MRYVLLALVLFLPGLAGAETQRHYDPIIMNEADTFQRAGGLTDDNKRWKAIRVDKDGYVQHNPCLALMREAMTYMESFLTTAHKHMSQIHTMDLVDALKHPTWATAKAQCWKKETP